MITDHPDVLSLERFLDDLLAESESHAIQRHLLICPSCEERLIGLLPSLAIPAAKSLVGPEAGDRRSDSSLPRKGRWEGGYDLEAVADLGDSLARHEASIDGQRREAESLWSALARFSPEVRRGRIEQDDRYATWTFCELLLERSLRLAPAEPAAALEAAELAISIADRLDPRELPAAAIASAQARAWAHLGNVRRIFADYREAERCFARAERKLAASWLDPLDEGQLLQFQASLDRDQGRFAAGVERLEAALEIYRSVNEPHGQGRCWISLGILFYLLDELETSEACLRRGASMVISEREPRLLLCAQQYLALGKQKGGRLVEALALLHDRPEVWAAGATEIDRLRLRWLEAQILASLDRLTEAQATLVEVQAGFETAGLPYDAALAGLELATIYSRRGLAGNARRAAERTLPIFRSLDTRPAFVAAVIVFESALQQDRLNLATLREITAAIERSRAGGPGAPAYLALPGLGLATSKAASAVSGAFQSEELSRPISLPLL